MKSKIIVDSSANVYQLPDVDFACVPLKILTDEQEYVDTEEVDAPALAQMMRTYKGRTSTSCPISRTGSPPTRAQTRCTL